MIGTISIIIPAGGRSERMGAANKLLLPLRGRTVLDHVVETALQAAPLEVIVVTGHDRENVERVLDSGEALVIHNLDFEEGMGATIRTGIASAAPEASGYAILLADLPFVRSQTIVRLAEHLRPTTIVVPTYRGERGHPVLLGRSFRDELLTLTGDVGGRAIIEAHTDSVVLIETGDPGTVRDIDTADDFDNVR